MIEPPAARYHLLPLAASFAVGIALGRLGPEVPWPWAWFLALTALFLLDRHPGRHYPGRRKIFLLWLVFALAGFLRFTQLPAPLIPPSLNPLLGSGQEVVISGRLASPPSFDGFKGKILLAANQHWQADGAIATFKMPLLLSMPFAAPVSMLPGDQLLLRATLQRPAPPGNPGTFDHRRYLADQGINITGFLRSPADLAIIRQPHSTTGTIAGLFFRAQRWRQQINGFIAVTGLPPAEVGLYQALLTGDRTLVPRTVVDDFRNSGTFHLLAISGMHLGLLALLSGLLIKSLLHRSTILLTNFNVRKITATLVLLLLALYAVLAGLQPPVVRALIMVAVFIGALLLDRPSSATNSLGLAALLALAWQPAALFQPSFQLSYLAVAGILAFSHSVPKLFSRVREKTGPGTLLRQWLVNGLAASTAAVFTIAPLTAFHFGQLSLLSPLSTLLVAPLICFWALPLGLAGILAAGFFPAGATIFLQAGALGLTAARYLTSLLSSLPLASRELAPPPLPMLALYYALLAAWLFGRQHRLIRLAALPALLASIVLVGFYPKLAIRDLPTSVTFLDVGQGAATLLQLTEGQSILVDGGNDSRYPSSFDLGEQVIAPFLRFRGLSRLDGLVISHDHADHYNGLPYIIEHFRPRTVWLNSTAAPSPGLARIIALATAAGSQIRVPAQGEILFASPTAQLICLSPFHQLTDRVDSENSRSLVLELRSWGHRIILPGDIMEEEGELLLQNSLTGRYAVMLAPHHGSDNSASLVLARASRPAWVVVSSGASPGGNFPGPELLAWCAANQARVHRTGTEGAISFSLTPAEISWQKLSLKGAVEAPGFR